MVAGPALPGRHTGRVARTRTTESEHAAVVAYYRAVGPVLLTHLAGRAVTGFGTGTAPDQPHEPDQPRVAPPGAPAPGPRGVVLHIADLSDLDEAVRSGVVGFRLADWPGPDRLALHIRAGEDSGTDVVATTTLALMELLQSDGVHLTALLDGTDGMYLVGVGAGQQAAIRTAGALADRSPEIATINTADTAGRALVQPLSLGTGGLPAPYSLVPGPDGMAVVAPLTRDEVAAATAGMPLEIDRAELVDRIRTRGDLALLLAGRRNADA